MRPIVSSIANNISNLRNNDLYQQDSLPNNSIETKDKESDSESMTDLIDQMQFRLDRMAKLNSNKLLESKINGLRSEILKLKEGLPSNPKGTITKELIIKLQEVTDFLEKDYNPFLSTEPESKLPQTSPNNIATSHTVSSVGAIFGQKSNYAQIIASIFNVKMTSAESLELLLKLGIELIKKENFDNNTKLLVFHLKHLYNLTKEEEKILYTFERDKEENWICIVCFRAIELGKHTSKSQLDAQENASRKAILLVSDTTDYNRSVLPFPCCDIKYSPTVCLSSYFDSNSIYKIDKLKFVISTAKKNKSHKKTPEFNCKLLFSSSELASAKGSTLMTAQDNVSRIVLNDLTTALESISFRDIMKESIALGDHIRMRNEEAMNLFVLFGIFPIELKRRRFSTSDNQFNSSVFMGQMKLAEYISPDPIISSQIAFIRALDVIINTSRSIIEPFLININENFDQILHKHSIFRENKLEFIYYPKSNNQTLCLIKFNGRHINSAIGHSENEAREIAINKIHDKLKWGIKNFQGNNVSPIMLKLSDRLESR